MSEDWVEVDAPPPPANSVSRLKAFVQSRQQQPGAWAQYRPGHGHASNAALIMKRSYPGLETTTRRRPDGKYDVYSRWPEDQPVS